MRIAYTSGYKYQLAEVHREKLGVYLPHPIVTRFISLDFNGMLTIQPGYAWDGPSGPTIDTLTFMRGSLIHDALYQLMRENYLDVHMYRPIADRILRRICMNDGMFFLRAWYVYWAVRLFASKAATPGYEKKVILAP